MNIPREEKAIFGTNSLYNFKYNGKELQETGFYDYGWRNYMSDIGRWFGMDQLSEMYSSFSTYAYVGNNPVMRTDPDGRKWAGNDMQALEAEYKTWRNSGGGGGLASYFASGGRGFAAEMNAYFGYTGSGWGTGSSFGKSSGTLSVGALSGVKDVNIKGDLAKAYVAQLQAAACSSITLHYDEETGNLTYTKNVSGSLTGATARIVAAIDEHSVMVKVLANNTFKTSTGDIFAGGAFMGNKVTGKTAEAYQELNPEVLAKFSAANGKNGDDAVHELDEALQGALLSIGAGVSSPKSGDLGSVRDEAHGKAWPQSGEIFKYVLDGNGLIVPSHWIQNTMNAVKVFYISNGRTILIIE